MFLVKITECTIKNTYFLIKNNLVKFDQYLDRCMRYENVSCITFVLINMMHILNVKIYTKLNIIFRVACVF